MGVHGIVVNSTGKRFLAPYLSYEVIHWEITHDTLIVKYTMKGSKVSMPNRKDTIINDFGVTDYWIIKEKNADNFIAESYRPIIPFTPTVKFLRTDKVE